MTIQKPILYAAQAYQHDLKRILVSYDYEDKRKDVLGELYLEKSPTVVLTDVSSTVEIFASRSQYFVAYVSTSLDHIHRVLNMHFQNGFVLLDSLSLEGLTVETARRDLEKLYNDTVE